MALGNNSGKLTFVNVKQGKLYIKPKDEEAQFFDFLEGTITKVDFSQESYNGQDYERANIVMVDGDDKYLLQLRTDSGYFRGFANSLRSGNPTDKIKVTPYYKEENGKPSTTCFVQQYGKILKHYFTRDNPGDYPQLEQVDFKGKTMWDGSKQIEYWKKWFASLQFENEFIASSTASHASLDISSNRSTQSYNEEIKDDLPF